MGRLILVLAACWAVLSGAPLMAGDAGATDRHGLLWNRTGLPAVFPLQVRTNPGADVYLVLTDAQTGTPALGAYIVGGRFFKVLVPPGHYHLRLAQGQDWQGEDSMFGAGKTKLIVLPDPLIFEVQGPATKAGHHVDMTDEGGEIVIRDSFICQRYAMTEWPRPQAPFGGRDQFPPHVGPEEDLIEFPFRAGPPRIPDPADRPAIATDHAPFFSQPDYALRSKPC